MKAPQNIAPDVSTIYHMDSSELNEVNDRIARHGWVLLTIVIERIAARDGIGFQDKETYVLGLRRDAP
jgi:hypothetical protein